MIDWIKQHFKKLLGLDDQPDRIAMGAAVGFGWGFTPLFGLKTLLSLGTAWLIRGNLVASVVAVSLHDLILPVLPVLLRVEYEIGYWILSNPHRLPPPFKARTLDFHEWWSWTTFLKVGEPVLLGSLVIAVPAALGCYFVVHYATVRYRKHQAQKAAAQA